MCVTGTRCLTVPTRLLAFSRSGMMSRLCLICIATFLFISRTLCQGADPAVGDDNHLDVGPNVQNKSRSAWIKQLKESTKAQERIDAARALGELSARSVDIIDALSAALIDGRKDVRLAALDALIRVGPASVPHLIPILRDADSDMMSKATLALMGMGPAARPAAVALVRALQPDVINVVREQLITVLIRLENRDVIPAVLPLLAHQDFITRLCAARVLGGLEAEIPAVLKAYESLADADRREIRAFAAIDLGNLREEGMPGSLRILLKLLQDDDAVVRERAANAIGKIGPSAMADAGPKLLSVMKDDPEASVKLTSAVAAWKVTADLAVAKSLAQLLSNDDPVVQIRAAQLLWQIRPGQDVFDTLSKHVEKENQVGELTVLVLGQIGVEASALVPEIAGHLIEPGKPMLAALALERIGPKAIRHLPVLTELSKRASDPGARIAATVAAWRVGGKPEALDTLKSLLEDKLASTRRDAALAYVRAAPLPKSAISVVKSALDSSDNVVRFQAADALRISGETDLALGAFLKLLRDSNLEVRIQTVSKIGMLGDASKPAQKELRRLLWDEELASHAAEAIGRIGPEAKACVGDLILRLQTSGQPSTTYSAACDALGMIGTDAADAVPALKAMLQHPRSFVRVNAALALLRIANVKDGEKTLESGLKSRYGQVRSYAAEGLWLLRKDRRSIPELIRILDQHEIETLNERYTACRVLGRIGKEARPALPFLKNAASNPDLDLSRAAITAVEQITGPGEKK